ncbi:MAG: LysR family transcriptional regulator [Kiloniellales bacterium]|nr:LysR family transcriptional regulator [Kiloniellales bacterium]
MALEHLTGMAIFARVVELKSFTRAARELGMTKSTVSKQIGRLEDRLGLRLLNRSTRQLSLTEAGAAFYQGCRQMVAEAEQAEQAVSFLAEAPRGTLYVNAPVSFGTLHLLPGLPDFLRRYPELRVEVTLNDRIVDLIEEGFDVGVRIRKLADSALVSRRLAPSRRILAASPDYLARRGPPQRPEDLAAQDCLIYAYQAEGALWRLSGPDGKREVKVAGRLRANNGEALLAAAVGGAGIAFLPTFICGDALRDGRLARVLPGWADEEGAVHVICPPGRNLLPKVRVFIDDLVTRCAGRPYWDAGIA